MPMLIEHIDAIARKKQRDVLYLMFNKRVSKANADDEEGFIDVSHFDWRKDQMREKVCQWLTEHDILWQECGHMASENLMMSYQGQIYLDVPFDETDTLYQLVRDYLENPDGTPRFQTVTFWYLPLAKAMENAHHDEPGFWENWAEKF